MATVKRTPNDQARLVVDPMENILVGSNLIMQYLRISSIVTMYQWVELYGLPAIKRPDGTWMTSISAIDEWMFMAAELDNQNRPHSRGYSQRFDIAAARLKTRMDQKARDDPQAIKRGPKPYEGADEQFAELTKGMSKYKKPTEPPEPNAA